MINDQTVSQFKPLAGTYDLISAASASIPLANSIIDVTINFFRNFGPTGPFDAFGKASELANEANEFFENVYQTSTYNFEIDLGSDLFSTGSKTATYIVGTLNDDTYSSDPLENKAVNGTSGKDVIQAGLGDDVVFASSGDDLIDGDAGDDVIDAGKGNDLIVSGEGSDKIIVGEGEDVVLDGTADDRLFFRASLVGGSPVGGEDRLIPLLGGVASYISLIDETS